MSANGSSPANGPAAVERKLTIDPPRGRWIAWAERTMSEGASAPRLPVRVAEAASRTPAADDDDGASGASGVSGASGASHRESVDAFLEYCKSHALRGLEDGLPEAHRRTVDALWRVHDARGGADVTSDDGRPLVPPRPTAELAPGGDSPGGDSPGAAGRVDLDASSRRIGPIAAHLARRVSTRPSTRAARASAAKLLTLVPAIRTGFDPATSDPGFNQPTNRQTEAYVAVVRACAGHAWADPRALHECARDVDAGFVAYLQRRGHAGKGKGLGKEGTETERKGTGSDEDKDAGGVDEYACDVEGLERRFLRAVEVPEFPEPAEGGVKEDVPDEKTKTKRRRSSAAAIAPTTTARKRAPKKKRPARVDGF